MKKIVLIIVMLFALIGTATAYTIVGNSVIEEDAYSKLEVYPHTVWNPTGQNYKQTFELTNKTLANQNVYVAYKFDNPLVNAKAEYYNKPIYSWVPNPYVCAPPKVYDANLNYYQGQRNQNHIRCYQTIDLNNGGSPNDLNLLIFDKNFNTYNLAQYTVYEDVNTLTGGNNYTNVTDSFSSFTYLNDTFYYTANPVTINAGQTIKWKATYTPNPLDTTNKWELFYYTGSGPGCILTSTCTYVHVLDPWYDNAYQYKQAITLNTNGIGLSGNITNDHAILVNIKPSNTDFWAHVDSTGKDVRFTNSTETSLLDYHFEDFNYTLQDANIWVEITEAFSATTDNTIYLYYGNPSAIDAQDESGTYPSGYLMVHHFAQKTGNYLDSTSNNHDSTSVSVNSRLSNGKIDLGPDFVSASNSVIKIGDSAQWDFTVADSFTLYAWAKSDITGTAQDLIRQYGNAQGLNQIAMTAGNVGQFIYRGTDEVTTNVVGTTIVANGAFHQIVGVKNKALSLGILYTNGAMDVNTADNMSTAMNINDVMRFGIAQDDTSEEFDGILDEVKIFNYALSADEVKLLYNAESNNGAFLTFGTQQIQSTDTNFYVVNEDATGTAISGVTIKANNITIPQNANGSFSLDNNTSFPLVLELIKTGYDTRTFYFDTNAGLRQSRYFGLIDENLTTSIDFQFYATDETTLLTDRWITVLRDGNGTVIGRNKTNSEGKVSFILNSQKNTYDFNIFVAGTDFGDSNIYAVYQPVTVRVNRPKNELNSFDINGNFNFDVGGLGLQNYVNQGSFPFSTIYILGNTESVYTLRAVDENSDGQQYYARTYIMNTVGDVNALTIQPYLIGINDGVLVNLITKNNSTSQTISNIRIQLLLGIGGVETVVEDQLTDVAGVAQFVMQSQKSYKINVTSPNESINYFTGSNNLVASSTSFTVWINYSDTNYILSPVNTSVSFAPSTNIITTSTQKFDINATTTADFNFIHLEVLDYNRVIAGTRCTSVPCNASFNVTLTGLDTNVIITRAVFVVNDTNYYQNKTYFAKPFATDIYNRIVSIRNDLSPTSLALIMFVIVFAVLGFMGSSIVGNNISQVFVVGIVFALMFYLWITDLTLWLGFFGAVFGVALLYLWSRNKGGV